MIKKIGYSVSVFVLLGIIHAHAQRTSTYTIIQAGGLLGINKTPELSGNNTLAGYKFHLTVGKSIYEKLYAGIGIGNDIYRGRSSRSSFNSRLSVLPIYADIRNPVLTHTSRGSIGVSAQVGYAPRIGDNFSKGFFTAAGVNYGHSLTYGSDLLFTVSYGLQQFVPRQSSSSILQHSLSLTVGLFLF